MYTSGSTGRPKGVTLTNGGLLHRCGTRSDRSGFTPGDRIAHLRSGSFIAGKTNIFATLLAGACALPFDIQTKGLHGLAPWLNARKITSFNITGSLFRAWLGTLDDRSRFPSLRTIACGSEPLYANDVTKASRHLDGDWKIVHSCGATEVGAFASGVFGPSCALEPGVLPIGRIVSGYDVRIENESEEVCACGEAGEIIIKSPYLALGYWNEPGLTAAAFRTESPNGARTYRTGDLGRLRPDGQLEHLGRKDRKVKLRGHSIELHEVESALLCLPQVNDAIVVLDERRPNDKRLVAYIADPKSLSEESLGALRIQMSSRVPSHMVPSHFVALASMPLTPRGKIDRLALPPLPNFSGESPNALPAQAPRVWSALEREIAQLWTRILRVDSIGLDDDFFLAGGDSLKAYELFAQLSKAYGVHLGLKEIFEDAATVAGIVRLIERVRHVETASGTASRGLLTIKGDGDRPPLFAVPGIGGNPAQFIHLGRMLDRSQPLIGIASRGIDGSDVPLTRMEQIAADNIVRIRSMQACGPYFLAGACIGGRIAYEMARQLAASGDRIGLLMLLDPPPPFSSAKRPRRGGMSGVRHASPRQILLRFVFDRIKQHTLLFMKLRGAERRVFLREKLATLRGIIQHRDVLRGDRRELHQNAVSAANRQAGRSYVPGPFSGPTVICFTRDRKSRGQRNRRLDWFDLVPQAGSATYVAGKDSGDMLKMPHVHELANFVNTSLGTIHANKQSAAE
jgi:thioesterase domain-containing protein/acyl carrier protein